MRGLFLGWAILVGAGALAFLDVPLLTFGQKFVAERRNERLVLMSITLNLVLLWAMGRWFFGLDRPILPEPAENPGALVGLAITALGVALAVAGKLRLGRWFSAALAVKQGHELVTGWPYSWVRHPVYAGVSIAVMGSALVWNSALTLLLGALLLVPFWFQSEFEEALFERHFGDAFRAYRARVPRLFPFPRP